MPRWTIVTAADLVGLVGTGASVLGAVRVGRAVRRRWFAPWDGPVGVVLVAVVGLAVVEVSLQALGLVGLLSRWPVILGLPVVTFGAAEAVARTGPGIERAPAPRAWRRPTPTVLGAALVTAVVVALWIAHAGVGVRVGFRDFDSLRYHGPFATLFAQQHTTTRLTYTSPANQEAFFPLGAELLDGAGMAAFGRDVLTPLWNLAWMALVLLAAAAVGQRWRHATGSVVAVAAVLSLPLLVNIGPATAKTDIAAAGLFLAAVAVGLRATDVARAPELPGIVLAGVAAGLAAGTKLTVVGLVVVLGALVVVLARRRPVATAGVFVGPALAVGGFWYVRNLVWTGNPVPWFDLRLGPLHLPGQRMPVADRYGARVLAYAGSVRFWSHVVPAAIGAQVGVVAFVGLVAAAAVLVGTAARRRDRTLVSISGLVAAGFLAYLVTPFGAGGPPGDPRMFPLQLRFLLPTVLVLVAVAAAVVRPAVAVGLSALVVGASLAHDRPWPPLLPAVVALVLGIAACVTADRWAPRRPAVRSGAIVLAVLLLVGGGCGVAAIHDRAPFGRPGSPLTAVYRRMAEVHHARIGVTGFALTYPLAGRELSNHVRYVGSAVPGGGVREPRSCRAWVAALAAADVDYVVAGRSPIAPRTVPATARWTRRLPGARLVLARGPFRVFRLTRHVGPGGCGPALRRRPPASQRETGGGQAPA